MTDLHKAAQQVLDWLYDNDVVHPTKVSEDLRAALAQQADKPQRPKCLEFALDFLGTPENGELLAYIEQLEARAALAQDQTEPKGGGNLPPPLQAEPVQEPVAWKLWDEDPEGGGDWRYYDAKDFKEGIDPMTYFDGLVPLYTAPPQRQPLAEWQITDLMADIDPEDVCSWSFRQGAYAAEKHHGIRP